MKNYILIICCLCFYQHFVAQKVINNPDCIINNISGSVTKVELNDDETIIHMYVRASLGSWIYIPEETYIENSAGKGKREYITKAKGISLNKKVFYENSDEKRFKLYFPPLSKDIKRINYGESNKWGSWFIYKLDLRKDGTNFIKTNSKPLLIGGSPPPPIAKKNNKNIKNNTIIPENLPKQFFGDWHDKHGTLLLITTPDYIVLDKRIIYYTSIQKIGDSKFKISTQLNTFEVLNLKDNTMTIRTNRLLTLKKKATSKKVPNFIKGKWLHWEKVKEIIVTDDYFYNYDKDHHGEYREMIENKIDHITTSNNGDLIWFVLYNRGNYYLYFIKKINDDYILQPRGYADARYKKINL